MEKGELDFHSAMKKLQGTQTEVVSFKTSFFMCSKVLVVSAIDERPHATKEIWVSSTSR